MLSINEIKIGTLVKISGEPYAVIRTDHHKMGRGGAVLKIKTRNLITGNVQERTLQGNEKIEKASTEKKQANYMYKDEQEAYFMDNETYEQFSIPVEQVDNKIKFLKEGTDIDVLYFENKPVAVDIPIKMKMKVTTAPPGVKGNSAGNVTKKVITETGASITAPLFIKEGDEIIVNTEKEEYVERA